MSTMTGTERNDTLTGTRVGDIISGLGGNDSIQGIEGNDSIDAGAGNDFIDGGTGNDSINGGLGNDLINGGAGADSMLGGAGNDVFVVDNVLDKVIELSNQGLDTINSSVSYTLPNNVEDMILTSTATVQSNGTGNALNNHLTLTDGSFGNLFGMGGNDVLEASTSGSGLLGGLGDDTYILHKTTISLYENANEGTDTVIIDNNNTYVLGSNVENLQFASGAYQYGVGNELNNVIIGNDNDGNLKGLAGNDTIKGGGGSDQIDGGPGNDKLTGDAGYDYFRFGDTLGNNNVDTITDFTSGQDVLWLVNGVFTHISWPHGALLSPNNAQFCIASNGVAQDANTRLIYDNNTGAVYYDEDGNGPVNPVQFATLTGHPALVSQDILIM